MSPENSIETIEQTLLIKASAAVIIADHPFLSSWKRKILLLQENRKGRLLWGPPGGGMKAHDDPWRTAVREVREEIGCDPIITGLVGVYTADRGDFESGIGFVFQGQLPGNCTISLNRSEGIVAFRFFDFQEVKMLLNQGLIYKPDDYNHIALNDYFGMSRSGYPSMAVSSLENKKRYWF